jgi:hypothetical protein
MTTAHADEEFVQLSTKSLKVYFKLNEQELSSMLAWHAKIGSLYQSSDGTINFFPCTRVGLSEGFRFWLGKLCL